MSNFITRSIDNVLQSISGPSIAKTLEQYSQIEQDKSIIEELDSSSKIQSNIYVGQDSNSLTSKTSENFDQINDEEYINSFKIFKIKPLRKFIELTYNANNSSIPNYERYFTFKLDIILMTWCCIAYCLKSIDQGNISNAYVTGMKEELNFVGKQYNWTSTYFTIGYAIMIIPSQIIITRVKPNIWIPLLELIWGVLTAICGAPSITSAHHLYPLRFLIGFFEASSWPGITVILMNWYGPEELSSRAAGFGAAGVAGSFFTGFMQAAISKTLDGRSGLSGWRWMFIINGIMTVIVALAGFMLLPSFPEEGGAFWLNKQDLVVAKLRSQRFQKKTIAAFTLSDCWRTIKNYRVWIFALCYAPWTFSNVGNGYFNLWLKSLTKADGTKLYSTYQVNMIPSGGYAISFVTMLVWAKIADLYNDRRFLILEINALIGVFGCAVLAAWPPSIAFKFVGYFFVFQMNASGPILTSLMADIFREDPVLRSITLGITVSFVYAMNAWFPLVIWPVTEAPHFKYGWNVSLGFETFTVFSIGVYFFVHKTSVIKLIKNKYSKETV